MSKIIAHRWGTAYTTNRSQVWLRAGAGGYLYRLEITQGDLLRWSGKLSFTRDGEGQTDLDAKEAHSRSALKAVLSAQADLHEAIEAEGAFDATDVAGESL